MSGKARSMSNAQVVVFAEARSVVAQRGGQKWLARANSAFTFSVRHCHHWQWLLSPPFLLMERAIDRWLTISPEGGS